MSSDPMELAERALAHLDGDGQASVVWERRASLDSVEEELSIEIVRVLEGRVGRAAAAATDDSELARAARAATLRARQARATPAPPLPEPAAGRPHDGWDRAVAGADPQELGARFDGFDGVRAIAARIAVASTTGVRAAEQRSAVVVLAGPVRHAAVALGGIDLAALRAELDFVRSGPESGPDPTRFEHLVLGPQAVARMLDALRSAFGVDRALGAGPLAGREGERVVAPEVTLDDAPQHPLTLPRSFDAEGVPRSPVTLIADGVLQGPVLDSAAAAKAGASSTGHATRAAVLAPIPEHLALAAGGAEDVAELARPVRRGLYVHDLVPHAGTHRAVGAVAIHDGGFGRELTRRSLALDPLAILAGVEALTEDRRLVPLRAHCAGGLGAALVPALRARA